MEVQLAMQDYKELHQELLHIDKEDNSVKVCYADV